MVAIGTINRMVQMGISGRGPMMKWCQEGLTVETTWSMTHSVLFDAGRTNKKNKKIKNKIKIKKYKKNITVKPPPLSSYYSCGVARSWGGGSY